MEKGAFKQKVRDTTGKIAEKFDRFLDRIDPFQRMNGGRRLALEGVPNALAGKPKPGGIFRKKAPMNSLLCGENEDNGGIEHTGIGGAPAERIVRKVEPELGPTDSYRPPEEVVEEIEFNVDSVSKRGGRGRSGQPDGTEHFESTGIAGAARRDDGETGRSSGSDDYPSSSAPEYEHGGDGGWGRESRRDRLRRQRSEDDGA